jgi:hypothetical protein
MVKFRLGFTVSAETLFALMSKVLPIDDLSVEEVMDRPRPPSALPERKKLPRKAYAKRVSKGLNLNEGINGIILTAMSDGLAHRAADLQPLVKAAGFSPNSVGSRLQALREHGVVKQLDNGGWRLSVPVDNRASA